MAADKYKIGDRVVVVSSWSRRHNARMNHLLGSIVTIDSICERVLAHNEREKFYRFAEAYPEGHIWDDGDIVGLAPMLSRPHFGIKEGQNVVFLAHDGSYNLHLGVITRITSEYFTMQDRWSLREFIFQKDDFRCVDGDESSRIVVYQDEDMAKKDQMLVRLQRQVQQMFWQYAQKIPSVEDLERVVYCIISK
jgi:hypothetical protein